MKTWDFRKNLTKDEWKTIVPKVKKRKGDGKETEVTLNGVPVAAKKLKKEMQHYGYDCDFGPSSPSAGGK